MILLAQNVPPAVTGGWLWGFVGVAVALGAVLFCWNQGIKALDRLSGRKTDQSISPQPFAVEITKQLHEVFAGKEEFEKHVEHNTERHGQLFNRIDKVERQARQDLRERFEDLAKDRQESLEKLNTQFTFIRENLAAINRELEIRNQ